MSSNGVLTCSTSALKAASALGCFSTARKKTAAGLSGSAAAKQTKQSPALFTPAGGELFELFEIVAAVDDARIHEGGGFEGRHGDGEKLKAKG